MAEKSEDDRLHDVARWVTHASGLPWTDPRSGLTYDPPPEPVGVSVRVATDAEQHEAILRWAQLETRGGAGHDCGEWLAGFRCMVCGSWIDPA